MAGQPTKYSEDIVDEICEMIATSSMSMAKICKKVGISYRSHLHWLRDHPEYLRKYELSKMDQADFLAEEIIEIADDSSNDIEEYEIAEGVTATRTNHEVIQRSRLRVDARKFIAAKLKPKKYGDRIETVITEGKNLPDWMKEGDE